MLKLQGIIPPMITPLDNQRKVDEDSTRRLVNFMLESGVDGLFLLGTMGEGLALETREQYRLVDIVLSEVAGKCPVLAGCSDSALEQTLINARQLEKLGVDALVVLQPSFFKQLSGPEVESYFFHVSGATGLPMVIYNNPSLTGNKIPLATMAKLMANPQFIGVKDSSSDFAYLISLLALRAKTKADFAIMQGDEMAIAPALLMGADGIVPGIGSLAGRFVRMIYEAVRAGERERALLLQLELDEFFAGVYGPGNVDAIRGHKEALVYLGIIAQPTTVYYQPLDEEKKARVHSAVDRWRRYLVEE